MRDSTGLDEFRETRSRAPAQAATHAGSGPAFVAVPCAGNDATCDEAPIEWTNHHELCEAARAYRGVVIAAFVHDAIEAVRATIRRARSRHLRRREMRGIYRALHELDDRTLRDLGFHRCEILSVAAEAVGEAEWTRVRAPLAPRAPS